MPPKTKAKGKRKRKFRVKNNRKMKKKSSLFTNVLSNLSLMPPVLRTSASVSFDGTLDTQTATKRNKIALLIKGSSLNTPFNQTVTGAVHSNDRLLPISSTWDFSTVMPYGLTRLLGTNAGSTCPYGSYRVTGSKISVQFEPTNQADKCYYVVSPINLTSTANLLDWAYISSAPFRAGPTLCTTDFKCATLTKYISTAQALGIRSTAVFDDGALAAQATIDPVSYYDWLVSCYTASTATWVANMMCKINITYFFELFNLNETNQDVT